MKWFLPVLVLLSASAVAQVGVCVSPDVLIPDDDLDGVSVPVTVDLSPGVQVRSVEVDVEIDHPWVGDLLILLRAPDGSGVVLLDRPGIPSVGFPGPFGCGGADLAASFADGASRPAESVCSTTETPVIAGRVASLQPLAVFDGVGAGGEWMLVVSDRSRYDTGVVREVCLRITTGPACAADLAEPFGDLNFFDVSAFLVAYNAADPLADFAAPFGTLDFFDVAAFLAAYNAGCP